MTKRIKRIQKYLGVTVDGVIGPASITAAEKKIGLIPSNTATNAANVKVPPGHSLAISDTSLRKIIFFEISSESYYRTHLQKPTWPGADSGVTIGIGYDLGHNSKSNIENDWKGLVSDRELERLKSVAGIKKGDAKVAARTLRDIKIPFSAASEVFSQTVLPRYAELTRKTYPGIEKLPADAQGAILSLIFNRGHNLRGGSRRREMRDIKPLVARKDLAGIADQIESMKRLWTLPGLLKRRDAEAKLVRNSRRHYADEETIVV